MKFENILLCVIAFGFILMKNSGCYYDNEEELYGITECETANMSYQLDIAPIIELSCFPCHRNDVADGSVRLGSYNEVKVWVDNGALVGAINHQSGFAPMPKVGGKLSECTISKIESWIDAGAPDN